MWQKTTKWSKESRNQRQNSKLHAVRSIAFCLSLGQSVAQPRCNVQPLWLLRSRGLQWAGQLNVKRSLSVQLFLFPPWLLGTGVALQKEEIGRDETGNGNAADDLVAWRVSNEMFPQNCNCCCRAGKIVGISLWAFLWLFGHKLFLRDNFTLFLKLNGSVMRRKMLPQGGQQATDQRAVGPVGDDMLLLSVVFAWPKGSKTAAAATKERKT